MPLVDGATCIARREPDGGLNPAGTELTPAGWVLGQVTTAGPR